MSVLVAGHDRVYHELLAMHDVDIVLTGMGGDAVFLGDGPAPYFLADLLRKFKIRELWTNLGCWASDSPERRPLTYWLSRCAVQPILRHLRGDLIEQDVPIPWASNGFAKRVNLDARENTSFVPWLPSVADSWFLEGVMRCANVISMRFHQRQIRSDLRHPLPYRPLIDFVCAVPWSNKLKPGQDRVLQRHAFREFLPPETIERRTKGEYDQAFYDGLESSVEWYRLLTEQPRIVDRGYVDLDRWLQAVRQARLGRTPGTKYFLASAMLEVWLQQLENVDKFRISAPTKLTAQPS